MKRYSALLSFITVFFAKAQVGPQLSASEIMLAMKKLNTAGAVLYVAAHPDDENTRLLAYLARERHLRTGYLSITRGDGGQNLVGKEQGEALGLVRTNELLAARRTDGAEQFFTRANDFGYSKTPEETFTFWNKDSVLSDMVLTIRRFRPDVIICRFPTTGEGGHGHHTASAILALEAFEAAADPKRFPEQLAATGVWQARRIFWNTFNFGTTNTTSPEQLKIDAGVFNALLGKSYGEIAAESRSMHKSQGFGSAKARGVQLEYFKLLKGDSAKKDLFEGIDQSWKRVAETAKLQKLLDDCIKKYNIESPEKSVPDLIAVYRQLESLSEKDKNTAYWKQQKLKEAEALILSCAGIFLEACAADYTGVPGFDVITTVNALNRSTLDVKLNKISYFGQTDTTLSLSLKLNELFAAKHKEKIPAGTPYSNPYWLNEAHSPGMYVVKDHSLIGKPQNEPAEKVVFDMNVLDLNLIIERALVYKSTDPVKGEVYRPFEILPPACINISDKMFVFNSPAPKKIQLTVKANMANVNGSVKVSVPQGWSISVTSPDFKLAAKNDEAVIECLLTPSKSATTGTLKATLAINETEYTKSIRRIEYDHIPYQFILSDAEAGLVNADIKTAGTSIGYIPGAGDDVPAALKQVGYTITTLTDDVLAKEDLTKFSAIVTGVRAYNTSERLQVYYSKLMDFVKNGGNLIVQYNTNNRIGPVLAKIGPFPFTISRDRVTNENAEVKFLKPDHVLLNSPNKITAKDFEGWIQERGIYFASEPDKNYETIFAMNDQNEKSLDGSLIVSKYGKGNFVYTGLVFFRELPAGVPGAYRLFVNLLSLPQNK
ncbi:MAG: PIG-L family deacetylase [Bacteroidia bacterium]